MDGRCLKNMRLTPGYHRQLVRQQTLVASVFFLATFKMNTKSNCPFVFLLGGDDAEMRRIREILAGNGQKFRDKNLGWDTAKASAYAEEFVKVAFEDVIPVLVELVVDCDLPEGAVVIDHHGARSGEPPALIQVLDLLGIVPERKDYLIGAMDAGYLYGLRAIGATPAEAAHLVGINWECATWQQVAQGLITLAKRSINTKCDGSEHEYWYITEATRAAAEAEMVGEMAVVRCKHSKTSLITAHLFGEQEFQNILILSEDGEVNHYGTGETVRDLVENFPGGWSGGAGLHPATKEGVEFWTAFGGSVPNNAFYGRQGNGEEVLRFLTDRYSVR